MKFRPKAFVLVSSLAVLSGCAAVSPGDRSSTASKERESQLHQQGIERQLKAIESRVSNIPDSR